LKYTIQNRSAVGRRLPPSLTRRPAASPLGLIALALALGGCSTVPQVSTPANSSDPVVRLAQEQVGRPYVYGGRGPEGFDCSGLVHFAHRGALGVEVPRTAREQFLRARPVSQRSLVPGDLVFFQPPPGKDLHVGIYVRDDLFVHAPSNGRRVSYANLGDAYWRESLVGAGRLR
jgi:cell wall-associated NlpC family hydrolase